MDASRMFLVLLFLAAALFPEASAQGSVCNISVTGDVEGIYPWILGSFFVSGVYLDRPYYTSSLYSSYFLFYSGAQGWMISYLLGPSYPVAYNTQDVPTPNQLTNTWVVQNSSGFFVQVASLKTKCSTQVCSASSGCSVAGTYSMAFRLCSHDPCNYTAECCTPVSACDIFVGGSSAGSSGQFFGIYMLTGVYKGRPYYYNSYAQ
eukprot:RCo010396